MALQTEAAPSSNAACKVANMYTGGLARIIVVKGRETRFWGPTVGVKRKEPLECNPRAYVNRSGSKRFRPTFFTPVSMVALHRENKKQTSSLVRFGRTGPPPGNAPRGPATMGTEWDDTHTTPPIWGCHSRNSGLPFLSPQHPQRSQVTG